MSIVAGDTVLVDIEGGEMQMRSLSQMVARAQPILRRHVPDDISLADKLIAHRRREEEPG
ncbi:AbrB/MazE/SpoVT family DNA-binding domain-containing protein [Paracoccus sediminis]|uniref:AbrB/MazE/SpoVT family DNA-binding domain-containing protein n=1 Tax=Paracoccus sediminis TaxID=1214787 RepID=A0A238WWY0_9RHOB|nr:AbrB family transcriptional regulator [Paracoccus sediminis]TBN50087.1 AbrB/MazE/SpoVT family DNA-binding domain-containing protein [Paracoccus sediminis]SNR50943.1 hypothetical protein SAMN06265378_106159 [Paracoccus sediminis]